MTGDPEGLAAGAPERPPSLARRITRPRTLASFAVAAGLLGLSLHHLGPETVALTWAEIRATNPFLYLAALGVYYLAFPVRSVRWRILLENAGEEPEHIPSVAMGAEIIYLSWFVNALTPAKLGDVYRGWLLRKAKGASWTRAMGTIVAERLLDVMVLMGLMIVMGYFAYRGLLRGAGPARCGVPVPPSEIFMLAGGALVVIVVGLVLFARYGGHFQRFMPTRVEDVYARFSGALILSFARFGPLLALSFVAWAVEAARFYLVALAMGQHLPVAVAFFFALLSAFLTTMPVTPGGVGFEFVLASALCLLGYSTSDAWAMALVDRSISYLSLVVGGALDFARSPLTK